MMDGASTTQPILPPGFRFHPTDEELVVHYLNKKASCTPLPVPIIADIDLYKFDPWELPGKASFGEQEWYFFSPRERKYPNGVRPNRAAASGYWKATGTDKPIFAKRTTSSSTAAAAATMTTHPAAPANKVGVKKALVFYRGRPPKGLKTNWIMHEYRLLPSDSPSTTTSRPSCITFSSRKSRRLDDWVLCRIYKKSNPSQTTTSSKLEGKEVSEGWSTYRGGEDNQNQVEVEQAKHVAGLPKRGSFTSVLAEADTFLDSIPMPGPNTIDTSSNNTATFSSNVDNSLSFYNYFSRVGAGGGGGGGGEAFLSSPCVTTPFSSPPSHSSIGSFPSNKPESDSTHPFNAPPPLDFPPYDVDFFVKQNNLFSLPSLTQKSPSCVLQQPPKLQVLINDPLSCYKWPYLARTS